MAIGACPPASWRTSSGSRLRASPMGSTFMRWTSLLKHVPRRVNKRFSEAGVLSTNALLPLNRVGLRADVIPTVEIEYAF